MSFSWPSDVYEVAPRGPFLEPANIGIVVFDRKYGTSKAMQMHLSCTPLSFILSSPNYTALVDFIYGNLSGLKSSEPQLETDRSGVAENASRPSDADGAATSSKPSVETRFNPSMKFGPEPDSIPKFRMTLAVPEVAAVFMAHPREWMDPSPEYLFASSTDWHALRPFFHASVSNLLMDLGSMSDSGGLYINFCANGVEIQDLRMGYRLTEVSARVPTGVEYEIGNAPVPALQQWGRGAPFSGGKEGGSIPIPGIMIDQYTLGSKEYVLPTPFHDATANLAQSGSGESFYGSPMGSIDSASMLSVASDIDTPPSNRSTVEPANAFLDSGEEKQGKRSTISVARRLSEHSHHRYKAMSDGHTSTPYGESRDHGALDVLLDSQYLPVLDFIDLEDPSLPSNMHSEIATLRIATAPYKAPEEERLPMDATMMFPGSNPDVKVEVSVAVLADSTTAVEIALSSVLLQWPYFQDLSLVRLVYIISCDMWVLLFFKTYNS